MRCIFDEIECKAHKNILLFWEMLTLACLILKGVLIYIFEQISLTNFTSSCSIFITVWLKNYALLFMDFKKNSTTYPC